MILYYLIMILFYQSTKRCINILLLYYFIANEGVSLIHDTPSLMFLCSLTVFIITLTISNFFSHKSRIYLGWLFLEQMGGDG